MVLALCSLRSTRAEQFHPAASARCTASASCTGVSPPGRSRTSTVPWPDKNVTRRTVSSARSVPRHPHERTLISWRHSFQLQSSKGPGRRTRRKTCAPDQSEQGGRPTRTSIDQHPSMVCARNRARRRGRERKQNEATSPGPLIRWGRRASMEVRGSEVRKKAMKELPDGETRAPAGQPALLTTTPTPASVRHRSWPDRPKHRAHCVERILVTHGAHGHWMDRRDSTHSSLPSPRATHRPGPRTRRQEWHFVIHENASSAFPRCHFYTRQSIICLPTDAHNCYSIETIFFATGFRLKQAEVKIEQRFDWHHLGLDLPRNLPRTLAECFSLLLVLVLQSCIGAEP